MSYSRILRVPRLAGLGGEAWVLPNPLTKPGGCSLWPVDLQVMIHPGENTWLISNTSQAPMEVGEVSETLLAERIRAMLDFNGVAVQSIVFSETRPRVLTAGGARYPGTASTTCLVCSDPIYATVRFNYVSSGPLLVVWPWWSTAFGYCKNDRPVLLLLETAGPKSGSPTQPGTKPGGIPTQPSTKPDGTPTQPGTQTSTAGEPAGGSYLVPSVLAAAALFGIYLYTRKPRA